MITWSSQESWQRLSRKEEWNWRSRVTTQGRNCALSFGMFWYAMMSISACSVHVWYCHVLSQDIASISIVTIVSATFYNPYCWYLSSSYGPLMVAAVNPVLPLGLAAAPLPSSGNRRTEWNSYRCDSHSSILSWCQGMGQDYGYTKGRFVFVHSSLCWTMLNIFRGLRLWIT